MFITSLTPPSTSWGLTWRSSTTYILTTIAIAMFVDLFLYGLIIPILPFILSNRLNIPPHQIQQFTSLLLASYAFASVVFSLPAGFLADRLSSRQLPFLCGLSCLFAATALLWLGQTLPILVLARILQGISASVVWTIGLAMIVDTVGSHRLGAVVGAIFSAISTGELLAPIAGGVMYEQIGEGAVFAIGFALLALDLVLRVCVVEKKVAKYFCHAASHMTHTGEPDEDAPLLSANHDQSPLPTNVALDVYIIPSSASELSPLVTSIPILYLLITSSRLRVAQLLGFTHAFILSVFDATVPLETLSLFHFHSLGSGLLFIPLVLPYLVFGPIVGLAVDRYGSKPASTLGLLYLVLPLLALGFIPQAVHVGVDGTSEIIKFSLALAGCGLGLAAIGAPSIVDASIVVERYHCANPRWFAKGGPYAQLYAVNSMTFSAGLTVGPLFAGAMRSRWGYGIMQLGVSLWCVAMAGLCFLFTGESDELSLKRRERRGKDMAYKKQDVNADGVENPQDHDNRTSVVTS